MNNTFLKIIITAVHSSLPGLRTCLSFNNQPDFWSFFTYPATLVKPSFSAAKLRFHRLVWIEHDSETTKGPKSLKANT